MNGKQKLSIAIERALPTMRSTASDLRTIASETRMSEAASLWLTSMADRLDTVVGALEVEIRAGTPVGWVRTWVRVAAAVIVLDGVPQAIGVDLWELAKDGIAATAHVIADIESEVVAYEAETVGVSGSIDIQEDDDRVTGTVVTGDDVTGGSDGVPRVDATATPGPINLGVDVPPATAHGGTSYGEGTYGGTMVDEDHETTGSLGVGATATAGEVRAEIPPAELRLEGQEETASTEDDADPT